MNKEMLSKFAVWAVIAMVLFTVFKQMEPKGSAGAGYVGYSEFLEQIRNKQIKSATIQEGQGRSEERL